MVVRDAIPSLGDVEIVSLGLDASLGVAFDEAARALREYADREGFAWRFAVAPPEVVAAMRIAWGEQLVQTTAEPMFLIDTRGDAFAAPSGRKDALMLRQLVQVARP